MTEKISTTADCGVRAAWFAELRECDKYRTSLIQRMKRARRTGDRRKFADLEKLYWATHPPMLRPRTNPADPLTSKISGTGVTDAESDKTIPRRLRSKAGRAAWRALLCWQHASESERQNLRRRFWRFLPSVGYPARPAAVALRDVFRCLDTGDDQFFHALGTALQEQQRAQIEKIKSDLIAYRLSLNWSCTPGRPRHTIEEIKQIVAPGSIITIEVFRNMARLLGVPFIRRKAGRKKQPVN